MTYFQCSICDEKFGDIPDDAIELDANRNRGRMYKFPDGTVHNLRRKRLQIEEEQETAGESL